MKQNDQRPNMLLTLFNSLTQSEQKWFACFGTLLKLARIQGIGITDDIDIGVIGNPANVLAMLAGNNAFTPVHATIDDITKNYLTITYQWKNPIARNEQEEDKTTIDIFFWKKVNGIYYHCYNELQTKDGVLDEYVFKGVPARCFEATDQEIFYFLKNRKYQEAMNKDGTWKGLVPGYESCGVYINKPFRIGECLDEWYPDWGNIRSGVSESKFIQKVKSCKDLK